MTNDQKREFRMLAKNPEYSAQEIAQHVGCPKATAAKSIRLFRETKRNRVTTNLPPARKKRDLWQAKK